VLPRYFNTVDTITEVLPEVLGGLSLAIVPSCLLVAVDRKVLAMSGGGVSSVLIATV